MVAVASGSHRASRPAIAALIRAGLSREPVDIVNPKLQASAGRRSCTCWWWWSTRWSGCSSSTWRPWTGCRGATSSAGGPRLSTCGWADDAASVPAPHVTESGHGSCLNSDSCRDVLRMLRVKRATAHGAAQPYGWSVLCQRRRLLQDSMEPWQAVGRCDPVRSADRMRLAISGQRRQAGCGDVRLGLQTAGAARCVHSIAQRFLFL